VDMQIPGFNFGGGNPDIYQRLSQIHQDRFPTNRAAPAVSGKQVAVPACFFQQFQIGNQGSGKRYIMLVFCFSRPVAVYVMLHTDVNVIVEQAAAFKPQNLRHPHARQRRQLVHGTGDEIAFPDFAPIPDKQLFEFKGGNNLNFVAVIYQPLDFGGRVGGNNPALDGFNHHGFESAVVAVNRGILIFLFYKAVQKRLDSRWVNRVHFYVFEIRQHNLIQIPLHVV